MLISLIYWTRNFKVAYASKELYFLTGMETRQRFSRMFVKLKQFEELFQPT